MKKALVIPLVQITSHIYGSLSQIGYDYCFMNGARQINDQRWTTIPWISNTGKQNPAGVAKEIVSMASKFKCTDIIIQCNRSTTPLYATIIPTIHKLAPKIDIRVFYSDISQWWTYNAGDYLLPLCTILKKLVISDGNIEERAIKEKIKNIQFSPPPGLERYFYPIAIPKEYDACFVGQSYNKKSARFDQERINWIKNIVPKLSNCKIALAGSPDWLRVGANYVSVTNNDKDPQKFVDCNLLFNKSRIVLGYDVRPMIKKATSLRTANALLSGNMLITKYKDGFESMFENHKHLAWFKNDNECIELVNYYLKNNEQREKVAKMGRQHAIDAGFTGLGLVKRLTI